MPLGDFGYPGFRDDFNAALNVAEVGSWANLVSMRILSDKEVETYRFMGRPAPMRLWIGSRQTIPVPDYVHTIKNEKYETTMLVHSDHFRREKRPLLAGFVRDFATRPVTHWETLLTQLITANGLCYDGQNFFDTDHSSGSSGTQINSVAKAQVPGLQVAVPTAPTPTEMVAAILGVASYFYTYKDDAGEPINQAAKRFIVMVPQNMQVPLMNALTTQFLAAGVANALLAQNMWTFVPIMNPRLATSAVFHMFRADGNIPAFIAQEEKAPELLSLAEGSDQYFDTLNYKWGIHTTRAAGYGLWQNAIKATLST